MLLLLPPPAAEDEEEEFKSASGTFESERRGCEGGAMRPEEEREPVGWWASRWEWDWDWGVRRG